jgi:N-methylhydantoinase B
LRSKNTSQLKNNNFDMLKNIDPIRLEVIKNGFDAIADEIALILLRTAYSSIVRDSMDYSTAICNKEGLTLAQGLTTPLHLGSFYDAMKNLINKFSNDIYEGDIFIGNDPYVASGQHLPDIYIVKPIFIEGQLEGWATTLAHHSDVGGIIAGSNSLGATEIYQEGLRVPFLKLYSKGKINSALWEIIKTNVRVPDLVLGDLQAQIVACDIGSREYKDMFNKYGPEILNQYSKELQEYAELLARTEISEIPDGNYTFVDYIDGLGENPDPIKFNLSLSISGDEAIIDWSGSSSQVKGGINSPLPFTKAAAYTALRSVMSSDVPNCHGYTKPIKIIAPEGSITNPVLPAACGARGITGLRMIDCLFGALSKAVPNKVSADGWGGPSLPTFASYRDGNPFVFTETLMGTWGATANNDGQDGVPHMGGNQSNVPIEMIELDYPLRIEEYGLKKDTGGAGKFRGGLSVIRSYRALEDNIMLSIRSDKRKFPPHGLFGGQEGEPSMSILKTKNDESIVPTLTTHPLYLKKNDLFQHVMAGGGGYGDPLKRDPNLVLKDVVEDKISIKNALNDYGVVIIKNLNNVFSIDIEATSSLINKNLHYV